MVFVLVSKMSIVTNPEIKIIQYAIDKYQRLSRYIEFTTRDKVLKRIVDDVSILKYNCKFGIWYYGDGQDYAYMPLFQDIDEPYNDMFKSYYKLLTYLEFIQKNKSMFSFITNRKKRQSELLDLRINQVKERCLILVEKLKDLEAEFITQEKKSDKLIEQVAVEINLKPELVEEKTNKFVVNEVKYKSSQFKLMIEKLEQAPEVKTKAKILKTIPQLIDHDILVPKPNLVREKPSEIVNTIAIKKGLNTILTDKQFINPSLDFTKNKEVNSKTNPKSEFINMNSTKDENSLVSMLNMNRKIK
jgi:hypothetical protein